MAKGNIFNLTSFQQDRNQVKSVSHRKKCRVSDTLHKLSYWSPSTAIDTMCRPTSLSSLHATWKLMFSMYKEIAWLKLLTGTSHFLLHWSICKRKIVPLHTPDTLCCSLLILSCLPFLTPLQVKQKPLNRLLWYCRNAHICEYFSSTLGPLKSDLFEKIF